MKGTLNEDEISLLEYSALYSKEAREYVSQISQVTDQSQVVESLDLNLRDQFEAEINPKINKPGKRTKDGDGESWDPLKEREVTPEIAREWRAIQLRGFVDPKKFYKMSTSIEPIPSKFDIGVIRDPNGIRAGPGQESQASGATNSRKRHHGTSIVTQLLHQDQSWTKKKYKEIQIEKSQGKKGWYQRQLKKRRIGKKK